MYHAQEKIVNVPGSEITGQRGGIHNSVTRAVLKPTHMIGGYAQQSYGFNYYGTIGTNRDEFVIVRRCARSTGSSGLLPMRRWRRRNDRLRATGKAVDGRWLRALGRDEGSRRG